MSGPDPSPAGRRGTLAADYQKIFGDKRCSTPAAPQPGLSDVAITTPTDGATIGTLADDGLARETAQGTAVLASGEQLWVFLYGTISCTFYFMERGPTTVTAGQWQMELDLVPNQTGRYVLYAIVVSQGDNRLLIKALAMAQAQNDTAPTLYRLPPDSPAAHITVICCK